MTKPACPTCGRSLFSPTVTTPTTTDPYLIPDLPPKFRLPGSRVAVQVVEILHDDDTATSTIIVRPLPI